MNFLAAGQGMLASNIRGSTRTAKSWPKVADGDDRNQLTGGTRALSNVLPEADPQLVLARVPLRVCVCVCMRPGVCVLS